MLIIMETKEAEQNIIPPKWNYRFRLTMSAIWISISSGWIITNIIMLAKFNTSDCNRLYTAVIMDVIASLLFIIILLWVDMLYDIIESVYKCTLFDNWNEKYNCLSNGERGGICLFGYTGAIFQLISFVFYCISSSEPHGGDPPPKMICNAPKDTFQRYVDIRLIFQLCLIGLFILNWLRWCIKTYVSVQCIRNIRCCTATECCECLSDTKICCTDCWGQCCQCCMCCVGLSCRTMKKNIVPRRDEEV